MKFYYLFAASIFCLMASSCSSMNSSVATHSSSSVPGVADKMDESRKVIYSSSVYMQVKQPDSTSQRLIALAQRYKGYVVSSSSHTTSIRVPSETLKGTLDEIYAMGKVMDKDIMGTDVTEEYTDNTIRLENAERARKRYLELLEKANTVEETLKVEKELERLNGEIDLLKGKLNRLNHLVEYSTITVHHREKPKPGIVGYIFVGAYEGIKWLFVRN